MYFTVCMQQYFPATTEHHLCKFLGHEVKEVFIAFTCYNGTIPVRNRFCFSFVFQWNIFVVCYKIFLLKYYQCCRNYFWCFAVSLVLSFESLIYGFGDHTHQEIGGNYTLAFILFNWRCSSGMMYVFYYCYK